MIGRGKRKRSMADFSDWLLRSQEAFTLVMRFAVFGPPVMYFLGACVFLYFQVTNWFWGFLVLAIITGWFSYKKRFLLTNTLPYSLERFVYRKMRKMRDVPKPHCDMSPRSDENNNGGDKK